MRQGRYRQSLIAITVVLILVMAMLAGGSLWILRRMHGQLAHTAAARQVLDRGSRIATQLADMDVVRKPQPTDADWNAFSREIKLLHAVEGGIQYVAVASDGVTVFHEQTRALEPAAVGPEPGTPAESGGMRMVRRLLDLGGETVPVVVFTREFVGEGGDLRQVEVAVRKDTVAREEQSTAQAIGSMFKLSLVAVVASFAVCALLIVWMIRREAQRERQRRAQEHLAFAGVMANGIVHDFRNPMSSMRLDVQMLNRELAKGNACRYGRVGELAERVQHTLDRMDKVFQEFLYLSRPPSDQREATELGTSLRECVSLLQPRFEQAEVKADLDLPAAPLIVMAYPSGLQRALMNVLTNAEQMSKPGDTVRVRVLHDDRQATVDIIDSGPGVPAADRHRIFEMFYSTRPGGTGLGLFLAKTALERCGGGIEVINVSPGACFRITLPLADPE